MTRPATEGFRKPFRPGKVREVRVAVISRTDSGAVVCSCGWRHSMARLKVLDDAVDRHVEKRHGGQGLRL